MFNIDVKINQSTNLISSVLQHCKLFNLFLAGTQGIVVKARSIKQNYDDSDCSMIKSLFTTETQERSNFHNVPFKEKYIICFNSSN